MIRMQDKNDNVTMIMSTDIRDSSMLSWLLPCLHSRPIGLSFPPSRDEKKKINVWLFEIYKRYRLLIQSGVP